MCGSDLIWWLLNSLAQFASVSLLKKWFLFSFLAPLCFLTSLFSIFFSLEMFPNWLIWSDISIATFTILCPLLYFGFAYCLFHRTGTGLYWVFNFVECNNEYVNSQLRFLFLPTFFFFFSILVLNLVFLRLSVHSSVLLQYLTLFVFCCQELCSNLFRLMVSYCSLVWVSVCFCVLLFVISLGLGREGIYVCILRQWSWTRNPVI